MIRRTRKIRNLSPIQEELVIDHLRKEWEEAERATKRHEFVRKAERAGAAIGKSLLTFLLLTGIATIAAVAPNAFVALGRGGGFRRHLKVKNLPFELRRGSSQSYWRYRQIGDGKYQVSLTPYGRKIALRDTLRDLKLHHRQKWDGLWRVVMFDIARTHDSERAALRRKLLEIGMVRIQDSVFVYPYPCTEEVELWASLLGVTDGVEILEAKFLTGLDAVLRREFKL
ncbi:MAG: hypothetical protein HYW65_02565 [Candidatus Liptonbacteria bacterium]|nr:hypothetical protein [Candidatus Liptonbacteria bacterium]